MEGRFAIRNAPRKPVVEKLQRGNRSRHGNKKSLGEGERAPFRKEVSS